MQKIDVKIIDKILSSRLKSNEITILLYIGKYQDTHGHLENLSYRFVTQETGMSKQTFYSSLRTLEEKHIIKAKHKSGENWGYFDVFILDNNYNGFSKADYSKKPYINTNLYAFLLSPDFIKLSGANKRLILAIIKRLGRRRKTRLTIEKMMEYSKVTSERSIFKFLKNVRKWFNVVKVKTKSTYVISSCDKTFTIKDGFSEAENEISYKLKVKCHKNKADYTLNDLHQTAKLYTHNKYFEKYGQMFESLVEKILETKGKLEYKLINWTLQYVLKKNGIKKKIAEISESEQSFIDQIRDEWFGKDNDDYFVPFSIA